MEGERIKIISHEIKMLNKINLFVRNNNILRVRIK